MLSPQWKKVLCHLPHSIGYQHCCRRSPAKNGNHPRLTVELLRHGCVSFIIDVGRKRTEANMITGPAWMLDRRTFAAANWCLDGALALRRNRQNGHARLFILAPPTLDDHRKAI